VQRNTQLLAVSDIRRQQSALYFRRGRLDTLQSCQISHTFFLVLPSPSWQMTGKCLTRCQDRFLPHPFQYYSSSSNHSTPP